MSSDDVWDTRLSNWSHWVVTGNGRGSAVSSIYRYGPEGVRGRAERTSVCLVGDALDVDQLVRRLNQDLQRAVIAHYVWTGTIREKAGRLSIHENTLRYRVEAAKRKLADLDAVARAKACRMRAALAGGAAAG